MINRRQFFSSLGLKTLDWARQALVQLLSQEDLWLRPPGALPEEAFLLACTRCGQCVNACPRGCLRQLGPEAGTAVGTPILAFIAGKACNLCGQCAASCQNGALASNQVGKTLIARLDAERCLAWQGAMCRVCYESCPKLGKALILTDFQYPTVIQEECDGCGCCQLACIQSDPAIAIRRREDGQQ
ncbi:MULTISPECIES: 4Fe-4S binding protein [unclassified Carboxydocella]|uniref:4Fe-4S binding protein n=1 Tax=unclassified Carboxydocella TaxID=2685367 RepID=UPI0013566967|nr:MULTISPECIES: 4Fe-4S binding protein [unclassified Carboxydocella]